MFSDFLAIRNNKFATFPVPNCVIFTLFLCFLDKTLINSHPFSHVFDSSDDAFNANVNDCMPFNRKNWLVGELSFPSVVVLCAFEVISRIILSIAAALSNSGPVHFLIYSRIKDCWFDDVDGISYSPFDINRSLFFLTNNNNNNNNNDDDEEEEEEEEELYYEKEILCGDENVFVLSCWK